MTFQLNKLNLILRSFESRNYRLFFMGQVISWTGTWMSQIASIWLVYQLTNSPLIMGLAGFAGQIPVFILTPFVGIIVDRCDRHRLLVITQVLLMVQCLILAILTLSNTINVWHIICLSIFEGLVNTFELPARQSFVTQAVEKKEYFENAIALNLAIFNLGQLMGPAIAGLVIAQKGVSTCYLLDFVSYLVVLTCLLAMKIKRPQLNPRKNTHFWQDFQEGLTYTYRCLPIRATLILLAMTSFSGTSYIVLMPLFATNFLGGNASNVGFLMAANGIGALIGTIYLSSCQNSLNRMVMIIATAPLLLGISLIIFAFSANFYLSLAMMACVGCSLSLQFTITNAFLQIVVPEDKRGRMMSFFTTAYMGMTPIGNLFFGSLANQIEVSKALSVGGIVCILACLIFYQKLPYLVVWIKNNHRLFA